MGSHKKGKGFGDGTRPLGRLADAELRKTKVAAHRAFDALWQSGQMKRRKAYAWLAKRLGIQSQDCHIGDFDLVTCRRVIGICNEYRRQTQRLK